jgi:hypothetical protein
MTSSGSDMHILQYFIVTKFLETDINATLLSVIVYYFIQINSYMFIYICMYIFPLEDGHTTKTFNG